MDAVTDNTFRDRQPEAATPAGADHCASLSLSWDRLAGAAVAALADGMGVLAAVHDQGGALDDFEWLTANRAAERLFGHPLAGRRLRADDLQDGEAAGLFAVLADCLAEKRAVRRGGTAPRRAPR